MTYDEAKQKYSTTQNASKGSRRKSKNAHEEDAIQTACATYCRLQYPDVIFKSSTIDVVFSGDKLQRSITGKRLNKRGYVPGSEDVTVYLPNARVILLEFKSAKGRQSDAQKAYQAKAEKLGHKYYIIRSLDDFIAVMRDNYIYTKLSLDTIN